MNTEGRDHRGGLAGVALPPTAMEIGGRSPKATQEPDQAGVPGSIPGRSRTPLDDILDAMPAAAARAVQSMRAATVARMRKDRWRIVEAVYPGKGSRIGWTPGEGGAFASVTYVWPPEQGCVQALADCREKQRAVRANIDAWWHHDMGGLRLMDLEAAEEVLADIIATERVS